MNIRITTLWALLYMLPFFALPIEAQNNDPLGRYPLSQMISRKSLMIL